MARSRTEAKERMSQGGKVGKIALPSDAGRVRDKVAAVTGVSGRTYEKAKQVVEAAERDPEASQRKIAGVLGVHSSTVDRDLNAGVAANAAPADVEAPKTAAVESLLAANAAPAPSPADLSGADAALLVAKKRGVLHQSVHK
jgi:autotransporter adhesin